MKWSRAITTLLLLGRAVDALTPWSAGHRLSKLVYESLNVAAADDPLKDYDPALLYHPHNFTTARVDHFHNETVYEPHSDANFTIRYWFDASHYAPGGPVFLFLCGETTCTDRLRILQKGNLAQLTAATSGVAVLFEHRYYGRSHPVANLSTANLRFLTTDQANADAAHFARTVGTLPGLPEGTDLRPDKTPWILLGASYSGGQAAIARKVYPDVFWGAISSSGVTAAITDYWRYYDAAATYGPPDCIAASRRLVQVVDAVLLDDRLKNGTHVRALKDLFGLAAMRDAGEFGMTLLDGIDQWQNIGWDPRSGSKSFEQRCGNLTAGGLLWPAREAKRPAAEEILKATGLGMELATPLLNWGGFIEARFQCGLNLTETGTCDPTRNATFFAMKGLETWEWRSWQYQVCFEWGYFTAGDNMPTNPPPIVSRTLTLQESRRPCRDAFGLPGDPDVDRINRHGGLDLRYPRIAYIDGEYDPWRQAGPHADEARQRNRKSTASEPFILIEGGHHHWDTSGRFANQTTPEMPPPAVQKAQSAQVAFVKAWLEEWKLEKGGAVVEEKLQHPF